MRAGASGTDSLARHGAVVAPLLAEVALAAVAALVDGVVAGGPGGWRGCA